MRYTIKPLLLGGVAVTAITVGSVLAGPAAAQCVASGSTVTCSGATIDVQAQQAVSNATPPNLSLNVNQGATIASARRQITVPSTPTSFFVPPNTFVTTPAFAGTVVVNNAGVIGTSPTLTTDLLVAGASRFTGVNSGVINGSVIVGSQFGDFSTAGAGSFANSGSVTGTVSLQGSGDQSYMGNGAIQGAPFPFASQNGVSILSQVRTSATGANNRQTSTVTGGTASATVDGMLRSTGTSPVFLGVGVTGIAGATAIINGQVGNVTVTSLDANTVVGTTFVNGGFDSTNNRQAVGGAATLTVGTAATVTGGVSVSGLSSAAATINGTVNRAFQTNLFGVVVSAGGLDATSTSLTTSTAGSSTRAETSSTIARLGDATALIAANAAVNSGLFVDGRGSATGVVRGSVTGPVSISSQSSDGASNNNSSSMASSSSGSNSSRSTTRGGTATLLVDAGGFVGGETTLTGATSAAATINGSVAATVTIRASAFDSASSGSFSSSTAGTTSNSQGSSTVRGGTASLTLGSQGSVTGSVGLTGATSAAATIGGTIGTAQNTASLSVTASSADSVSTFSSASPPAGSSNTSVEGRISSAGAASAIVSSAGRVFGSVNVSGGTSATATIDGTVGASSNPFNGVFVSTSGVDSTNTSTTTFSAGGTSTQTQENISAARGGGASVTVGAAGSVAGSVSASSTRGIATATLAGRAGIAGTQTFPTSSLSAIASGNDTRFFSTFATGRNGSTNSSTAVGGQATATVLAGGVMAGDVVARGDAGATLVNSGMVAGPLRLTAGAASTTSSNDFNFTSSTTAGVTTSNDRSAFASSSTPAVAVGTISNTGTANSVAASSTGNLTFRNDGIITGNIGLTASTSATTSESLSQRNSTSTPAIGGGATTVATSTSTSGSAAQAIGGNIVATYGGMVGVTPVDPRQTQPTQITQVAVGSSTATITGLVLGSITSSTGGANTSNNNFTVTNSTTQPFVGTGLAPFTQTTVTANRSTRTIVGGPSSVIVSGTVRNDGLGNGGVTATAATGVASATVNGGAIEGALVLNAGQGGNHTASLDRTATSTLVALTDFSSTLVDQASTQTSSTVTRLAGGTATATLTGARVGSVQAFGVGTGAGSAASTVSVDAASTAGAFTVAAGGVDSRSDQTNTLANGTRTIVNTQATSVSTLAGNARADVAGRIIGAASASSQGGNATLNLTGVAAGAVNVNANASDRVSTTTQTFAVTNTQGFPVSQLTGQTTTTNTTARGGLATLAIASSGALQATGANAVGGSIDVNGFGGSVLTVAAGSRVLTGNTGAVRVVGTTANLVATTISTLNPIGISTGSTIRQTVTSAAGPASITNAGAIGAPTTYFTAPVAVLAQSVGGATIANSGQIYGNVAAAGLGERRESLIVQTQATATTPFTSVNTTTFTPLGAGAGITNSGIISGRAEVSGATGSIGNTGVIRGAAQLGAGVRNYTNTVTSTTTFDADGNPVATSVTSPATAPTALFGQTLTLDQNGLVLGGVRVEGATTADPANGAAIRTSTITATVNLNGGSVTLGDVTGQQDASGRLTRTAVNLTGDGFLGAGPTLQVSGGVRFAATPNYAGFAATDPALGAVTLASGSRINGVDSVTKTGGGAFTIVGAPLLRSAGTTTFTVDTPLRVAGGELQLGVAGVDPATGQGVFGVRGAVQNDATLVLGRRITNGTLSGVQGVTLAVTGNVTQSSSGTLVLAAAPQPALQTAPALATTPSFLTVDGSLSLGGVASVAAPQGIYVAGRGPDFASVSGAFTSTATVNAFTSPFVNFGIVTRVEGGRTIAAINVTRTPFASVARNGNAAAAGGALQAAIPAAIAAGAGSDLAAVIGRLDTGTAAGATATLDELGQASFYGSLAAVSITRPFGEVADVLAGIDTERDRPVSLWMRAGGSVSRIDGDAGTGARRLIGNNLGAIVGVDASAGGISLGVGVGPGWTDANAGTGRGRANGWMVGAYAGARFGPLSLAGQGVIGWTDWTASRTLPSFGRYATTSFNEREVRLNGRAALDLSLGEVSFSPFAGVEWRQWRFDGFSERNAGALGVTAGRVSGSVLSPEAGARIAGTTGWLRAYVEGAYVFQGNIESDRAFSLVGPPSTFTVRGVKPGDYGRISSGLETDVGRGSFFVRGDVWEGGGNRLGAVRVGARIRM